MQKSKRSAARTSLFSIFNFFSRLIRNLFFNRSSARKDVPEVVKRQTADIFCYCNGHKINGFHGSYYRYLLSLLKKEESTVKEIESAAEHFYENCFQIKDDEIRRKKIELVSSATQYLLDRQAYAGYLN